MSSSSKRRRISNTSSKINNDEPNIHIEEKDIYNFKEDYRTEHYSKFMILHKPMEIKIMGETFLNGFKLGKGSYSSVYKLINKLNPRDNDKALAIKIFKSPTIYKKSAIKEINSLTDLKACSFIIDIVVYFKITNNHITIVTPFYDLNLLIYMETYLQATKITYDNYMNVFVSLLNATKCMINYGISSTDMKPENIFLNVKMDGTIEKVVLGDFSSPLYLKTEIKTYNAWCYTKYYRPPEIIFKLEKPFLKNMDLWSLGCVLYELYYYTQKVNSNSILFECNPDDSNLYKSNKDLFLKQVNLLGLPNYSYFEKYEIDFCEKYSYINSEEYKRFKEPNKELLKDFSNIPFGSELIIKYLNWDPDSRPTPEESLKYIKEM